MDEKKFYLTIPIFYANAELHLGHTYTMMLADIIARYHRGIGDNTFFLAGSDEHGEKIVRAAQKEGLGPQAFVNNNVAKTQELMKKMVISNDAFVRTSDHEVHWPGAQKMWRALEETGDIYKGTYEGLYCVGCEAFITEKELVDGKCPHHDTIPDHIKEENYFFKLSKYAGELKRLLESGELKITPQTRANEMIALFGKEGGEQTLADVSISRPEGAIPWGIPVPNDPGQLMYVWCDALSNYISALGYGRLPAQAGEDESLFSTFWPADVQVLGKDIVRFHALLWPAMLLSVKLPLPKELLVHGFVTSGGKKMSKSLGNVLKPHDFIDEYGVDALRYYLSREVTPTEDWDLTLEKFKEAYNANLANGLGNLVSRTLKMAEQYFGGQVTGSIASALPVHARIAEVTVLGDLAGLTIPYLITNDILPRYHAHMRAYEVNKAADVVWELIGYLDQYIADYEPFKLVKTDKDAAEKIIWSVMYGIADIAEMITPFLPDTATKIKSLLGASEGGGERVFASHLPSEPLFMRKE
ncbi:MAG TPA: methionine--tRNA ligase [Candidatus Yonathbacteria bacterium]|nr:methionine--tRNA ligase [Candidatus Yonathbacteria bacterium]